MRFSEITLNFLKKANKTPIYSSTVYNRFVYLMGNIHHSRNRNRSGQILLLGGIAWGIINLQHFFSSWIS